jgi:hypothetical protein
VVNFYIGYKLQQRVDQSRAGSENEIRAVVEKRVRALSAADTTPFVRGHSVVEKTTELLEPIPRETKNDDDR